MTRQQEPRRHHYGRGSPAASSVTAGPVAAEGGPHRDQAIRERLSDGPAPARPRAIPNITIHAFCEAGSTAEALQAASADRRLARVHMEVATGGIGAAVAECAEGRTPNILVVETTLPPAQ